MTIGFVALALPVNADPLKPSEILRYISGDWDYVLAPYFEPGANFCKASINRMWMEGQTYHHRSIRRDQPVDYYFMVTTGRVINSEMDAIVIAMSLPPQEKPANLRIQMRSEDFAIIQVRDSPPFYLKRCPTGELTS
jgi:hypothetical protein